MRAELYAYRQRHDGGYAALEVRILAHTIQFFVIYVQSTIASFSLRNADEARSPAVVLETGDDN